MLFGLEWYWWLAIIAALIVLIPVKVKFMKWWSSRQRGQKKNQHGKYGEYGKWGEDE